ncbi:MAG: S8 family serine peptidase [Phycisphaerae bacterium]
MSNRFLVESLEARRLLSSIASSVTPGFDISRIGPQRNEFAGRLIERLEWQGEHVMALKDRWIVDLGEEAYEGVYFPDAMRMLQQKFDAAGTGNKVVDHMDRAGMFLVEAAGGGKQLQAELGRVSSVVAVSPDKLHRTQWTTPNDPRYNDLWGIRNVGQTGGIPDSDIDGDIAWATTKGEGVVVAIIDTGIDLQHPDLVNNLWVNPNEIPGNGIDDDGNGRIDDVYGWDFLSGDNNPDDVNGHGTHVAGTVAMTGNNGIGGVGVAPGAKVMALRAGGNDFFDRFLSTAAIVSSINYVNGQADRGVNVKVTNHSYGGGSFDSVVFNAMRGLRDRGIVAAAASGNDGDTNVTNYPANYNLNNIISVGWSDHRDQIAPDSNRGSITTDVFAPGNAIYSTAVTFSGASTYATFSGTSMASPHVAGVAALLFSAVPTATHTQVIDAIYSTVEDPRGNFTGFSSQNGRVNAAAALAYLTGTAAPAQPTMLASSDTGISDSDGITNVNTPTFTGSTDANLPVNIYINGVLSGSTTSDGSGIWSFTPSALADGEYELTATVVRAGEESSPSQERTFTIDTIAPVVLATTVNLNTAGTPIFLQFDEPPAEALLAADFDLNDLTNGVTKADSNASLTFDSGLQAYVYRPLGAVGGRLDNADYELVLPASAYTDVAGNGLAQDLVVPFWWLNGDFNRDRKVGLADFNILASNFGLVNQTFASGDADGNGTVNLADFNILATNFGLSLSDVPPASSFAVTSSTTSATPTATAPAIERRRVFSDARIDDDERRATRAVLRG